MKQFLKVIFNVFKGLSRTVALFVFMIICTAIKVFTYEPGTKYQLTKRKAKRIRLLTKLKLFVFNHVPNGVSKFFGVEEYKDYLNKHLGNGMQLRYERTDKRAV